MSAGPAEPWLTWLYAPGDRPDTVAKALRSGADVVLVDLEDAVAGRAQACGRRATAPGLSAPQPVPVHVRVNPLSGAWGRADVRALAGLPGLGGLRLPKVASPGDVVAYAELAALPREADGSGAGHRVPPLWALLESALGVEHAYAVARAHPAVRGLALGEADLRADLGMREEAGLDWARGRVVVACRAAGLDAPVQSVHPDVRDEAGLAASCARGRALGFLGRAAIHPRQLPVIERAYLPLPSEVAAAQEIVAAGPPPAGGPGRAPPPGVDAP
ncbi:HpcH/HpaI aldolase/citrate lyase family protein, partial [Streptomyces albidoflavus]